MNKKRTFFCGLLMGLCLLFSACAALLGLSYQHGFKYSIRKGGYWGTWRSSYGMEIRFYSNPESFIIYPISNHPSDYAIKVTCKNEISKDGGWHKYKGTIEYYTKNYRDSFYLDKFPDNWPHQAVQGKGRWNMRNAEIWIRGGTFEKAYTGHTINVFFDGVGFGLEPK